MTEDNKNIQPLQVPIDSLQLAEWDIRRTTETPEEFESFKNSIQENGLIYPLTVVEMTNTDYFIVVAGRRRLRVLKDLGWKTVPVIVQFKDVTETELRRITLIENLHRKNLADIEKGFGIVAIYEAAGYTSEEAIKGAKSIDNWFGDKRNQGKTWEDIRNTVPNRENINTSALRYDQKFIDVCKSIHNSPKYQYQMMQIVLQLDPDVLATAQRAGLSRQKKLLLTKSQLKDHPSIQKNLIPKLQRVGPKQGEVLVNQKLRDIETGYIEPSSPGSSEFVYSEKTRASDREKVQRGDTNKILDLPTAIELDIIKESNKMIRLLTGRTITRGERGYSEEIIDKNKERMYKIAKSLNKELRLIEGLEESLKITNYTIYDMIEILRQEREAAVNQDKQDIGKR